jgi:hypothetical protein
MNEFRMEFSDISYLVFVTEIRHISSLVNI